MRRRRDFGAQSPRFSEVEECSRHACYLATRKRLEIGDEVAVAIALQRMRQAIALIGVKVPVRMMGEVQRGTSFENFTLVRDGQLSAGRQVVCGSAADGTRIALITRRRKQCETCLSFIFGLAMSRELPEFLMKTLRATVEMI